MSRAGQLDKVGKKGKVLYSEREVAQMGFKSAKALRNDRYSGVGIPWIRVGRSIRYHKRDLIRFMNDNRVVPENQR